MTLLIATTDTYLTKQPVLEDYLPEDQKLKVHTGKVYRGIELLKTEGKHAQFNLGNENGVWWLWLPHWSGADL